MYICRHCLHDLDDIELAKEVYITIASYYSKNNSSLIVNSGKFGPILAYLEEAGYIMTTNVAGYVSAKPCVVEKKCRTMLCKGHCTANHVAEI